MDGSRTEEREMTADDLQISIKSHAISSGVYCIRYGLFRELCTEAHQAQNYIIPWSNGKNLILVFYVVPCDWMEC